MSRQIVLPDGSTVSEGNDRLSEVLGFLNSPPALSGDSECQALIRECIGDLIRYGSKLAEIDLRLRTRKGLKSRGLTPVDRLMRSAEADKLNRTFYGKGEKLSFLQAYERIKPSLSFAFPNLWPPAFFRFRPTCATAQRGEKAIFDFLDLCRRIDPRSWGICASPRCPNGAGDGATAVFVKRRLRASTRFCSPPCRFDFQNAKAARKDAKKQLARRKRKSGHPAYH